MPVLILGFAVLLMVQMRPGAAAARLAFGRELVAME